MTTTDLGNGWFLTTSFQETTLRNPDIGLRCTLPSDTAEKLREALRTPPGSNYCAHLDQREREIIDCVIRDVLIAGGSIEVQGDGEVDLEASTDYAEITSHVAACAETMMILRYPGERKNAFVYFVHGNGTDVLCDYTASEMGEAAVKRAMALADTLSGNVTL